MNREKVYYKTVGILINAYHNKTLNYTCGASCAVGNLIAANMGYAIIVSTGLSKPAIWKNGNVQMKSGTWYSLTHYSDNVWQKIQTIKVLGLRQYKLEKKHIAATGYAAAELKRIEIAFESCFDIFRLALDKEQDILKGLDAVFAVLWDIHQITSEDFTPGNKTTPNNSSNAIIERLVNRYEALSFIERSGVQKIYERQP